MTVRPGFGGQKFLVGNARSARTRQLIDATYVRDIWLQIDGGVSADTIERAAEAGADPGRGRIRRVPFTQLTTSSLHCATGLWLRRYVPTDSRSVNDRDGVNGTGTLTARTSPCPVHSEAAACSVIARY